MMVLNGEEGLECEVHVDVSEFNYLECILTNHVQCRQKDKGVVRGDGGYGQKDW